jgi:general secretion pathway protein A
MYESFYGFKEKPFTLTPDPRYFYPSRAHREALDHLLYGIREREGFIVITGDVGTGKTTLCRAILQQLEEGTSTAVILNPVLSEDELLRAVLRDFGLTGDGRTKYELIDELNEFLMRTIVAGKRAVLIIDEAQNLSFKLLEQIRLLSNLETERDKLIQIILVGQLGLVRHLASQELKQLNQRVSVRYKLRPLTYQETCQYVYHRLMVAGGTTGVSFAPGALRAIYEYSSGIPRLINLATDRALLQGYADQTREISKRGAAAGIQSLVDEVPRPRGLPVFARWAIRVLVGGIVLAGSVTAGVFADRWMSQRNTAEAVSIPAVSSPAPFTNRQLPVKEAVGVFGVLVGTFATEPEARDVEQRLASSGYTGVVARRPDASGASGYSLLVGRFGDTGQAKEVRDRLAREHGFPNATIVRTIDVEDAAQ